MKTFSASFAPRTHEVFRGRRVLVDPSLSADLEGYRKEDLFGPETFEQACSELWAYIIKGENK